MSAACVVFCKDDTFIGPLLFLLYIDHIYTSSDKLSFYLFADDTNLLYAEKNLRSLKTVVILITKGVKGIYRQLAKMADKLSLNVKKWNFIIFRPYQKRIDYQVNIKIFDS